MATTTVDSATTSDRPLQLDSIPTVDLSLLSQSELYSLSLCSDSAFDLRRCDDVVIPKIDRSVFNESAGSRKQTYSRLRLAPAASSTTIHRRTPHLRPHIPPSNSTSSENDPEQAENSQIISLLKGLFKSDPSYSDLVSIEVECSIRAPVVANPVTIVGKRKRGRPRKGEIVVKKAKGTTVNDVVKKVAAFNNVEDNRDREIVNSKGVILDMVKLAELEDPYGPEITRRTLGMTTADQLLGFLNGLNGVWGSRRKKKRVVDASDFGDALPKGWKLSLSIKKKVGRVWLFCRRYISPSGRQFASCRDVSAYLLSIRGPQNSDKPNYSSGSNDNEHAPKVACGNDMQINGNGSILAEESCDIPVRSSTTSNDKVCSTEEVPDVVTAKSDMAGACEPSLLLNNDNNSKCEPSGETHVTDSVDNKKTDRCFLEQEASGSCVLSPFPNEQTAGGVDNNVIAESADTEVLNEEAISEIGLLPSSTEILGDKDFTCTVDESTLDANTNGDLLSGFCNAEVLNEETVSKIGIRSSNTSRAVNHSEILGDKDFTCTGAVNHSEILGDKDFTCTVDESALDVNVNGDLLSGFCNTRDDLNEDGTSKVQHNSISECEALVRQVSEEFIKKENGIIPSMNVDSELKESPVSNVLIPTGDNDTHTVDSNSNTPSSSLLSTRHDSKHEICINQDRSYNGSDRDVMRLDEEEKNYENCEPSCLIESNKAEVSTHKLEETNLNEFQAFEKSEPIVPVDGNRSGQNPRVMTITKENNLEFSSLVPSGNEQNFDLEDDVTGIYDSAMEDCKDESSERGLLNHFCIEETSDDVFGNKLYNSPLDELKFDDDDRGIGNHELSLAFGNPHEGLYADTSSVEQKRDLVSESFAPSEIDQGFGVQTNLSMVNSSMVQDFKEGRDSLSDLFSLSCNSGANNFGNNLSTVYTGREWDGHKMDVAGNSINKNYMAGFGSSPYQRAEHVMPSAMWRTGQGNAIQSRSADFSHPPVQSPSSFRTFDIMSDKAEDGLFRLGDNYNNGQGVNRFRPGRSEPIEFSFLTAHNSNSFQGNSKVFSYGTEMGQEFNHSFWLGKDAMMSNTAVNQVTSICVWCRNEFQHDPAHSGIQAGIGSMCPNCKDFTAS